MTESVKAVIAAEVTKVKTVAQEAGKDAGKKIGKQIAASVPVILSALAEDSANKIDDAAVAIIGPKIQQALEQIVENI